MNAWTELYTTVQATSEWQHAVTRIEALGARLGKHAYMWSDGRDESRKIRSLAESIARGLYQDYNVWSNLASDLARKGECALTAAKRAQRRAA